MQNDLSLCCQQIEIDYSKLMEIINEFRGRKSILIPLLQKTQDSLGFIPSKAVEIISEELGIPSIEIYGVITFYSQFYHEPCGKHKIRVCTGTACYIMGGKDILGHIVEKLDINPGESTKDGLYYLEKVACLGCCGMAPVVDADGVFVGSCTAQKVNEVLEQIREKENNK